MTSQGSGLGHSSVHATSSVSGGKHFRGTKAVSHSSFHRKKAVCPGGLLSACLPSPGLHITAPVQLPFALCHSARFFQEVGGWVCSHIEAYLLHCLSEETNCVLASFARLFQKVAPSTAKCRTVEKTGRKWNLGKAFLFKA